MDTRQEFAIGAITGLARAVSGGIAFAAGLIIARTVGASHDAQTICGVICAAIEMATDRIVDAKRGEGR